MANNEIPNNAIKALWTASSIDESPDFISFTDPSPHFTPAMDCIVPAQMLRPPLPSYLLPASSTPISRPIAVAEGLWDLGLVLIAMRETLWLFLT